jgi:hypothetical protein
LKDFGSQNGTYVNGERVNGRRALNDGDRVNLGKYRLVFHSPTMEASPFDVQDPAAYSVAGETDILPIMPDPEIQKCPFVGGLIVPARDREAPRIYKLDKDVLVVGSDSQCDIVVTDSSAPRRAALILRGWTGFQVVALGPGVQRNGAPLENKAELNTGDELLVGASPFKFRVGRPDVGP